MIFGFSETVDNLHELSPYFFVYRTIGYFLAKYLIGFFLDVHFVRTVEVAPENVKEYFIVVLFVGVVSQNEK